MSTILNSTNRRTFLLVAVLLLAVTVATLVSAGATEPRAKAAPEPRTRHNLTIPAAHFHPTDDNADYHNLGQWLRMVTGAGSFYAPVSFPYPGVTVRKITMFVLDNDAADNICLGLHRAVPRGFSEIQMAFVCSQGASNADRTFSDITVSPKLLTGLHGPYLWLSMPAGSARFYGMTIVYTA